MTDRYEPAHVPPRWGPDPYRSCIDTRCPRCGAEPGHRCIDLVMSSAPGDPPYRIENPHAVRRAMARALRAADGDA